MFLWLNADWNTRTPLGNYSVVPVSKLLRSEKQRCCGRVCKSHLSSARERFLQINIHEVAINTLDRLFCAGITVARWLQPLDALEGDRHGAPTNDDDVMLMQPYWPLIQRRADQPGPSLAGSAGARAQLFLRHDGRRSAAADSGSLVVSSVKRGRTAVAGASRASSSTSSVLCASVSPDNSVPLADTLKSHYADFPSGEVSGKSAWWSLG